MVFWEGTCAPRDASSGYGTGAANRGLTAEAEAKVGDLSGQTSMLSKTGYNWRSTAGFNDPAVFISRNIKNWSLKGFSC